jgi:hypothetical protein
MKYSSTDGTLRPLNAEAAENFQCDIVRNILGGCDGRPRRRNSTRGSRLTEESILGQNGNLTTILP